MFPRERALSVAALRVAIVGILLATNEPRDALHFIAAGLPWSPPEGLRFLAAHAASSPGLLAAGARAVFYAYSVSAVLALLGLYTRAALAMLLASAWVLFGIVQLGGAVVHDMHLLWLLAILLACPSGDALSVDAWLASAPGQSPASRLVGAADRRAVFGFAVFAGRTLLGVVYFFPGFWKLHESGLAWALSDNLALQMHAKWLENGIVPEPRIDRMPAVIHTLGLLTLAFELSFVALVHLGPRVRLGLAGAGLAFHAAIQHFMLIPFTSLCAAYVLLLPWGGTDAPAQPTQRGLAPVSVVGAVLVAANVLQGLRGRTQSYPFACYPTFQWIASPTLPDLALTALGDGAPRVVPHARDDAGRRTQQEWGTVWSVAGLYGVPFSTDRLVRYLAADRRGRPAVERALRGATRVRADVVWLRTDPDAWGSPAVRTRELGVVTLGTP
ncbi:MAG TPA: hypothetical protein VKU41_01945 [Polyangiaceae bacterium]|nr:hypothetical protein [Polyangiaceae bacterium]